MTPDSLPFLYGCEYYRAPTPARRYWAEDLQRMADAGFNAVKLFIQWRWVHRGPDRFWFDDHDELMDLAAKVKLPVTINLIFDTAPVWLFDRHPEAYMVTADGQTLISRAVVCRQIGGYPGPCFNHEGAWAEREAFIRATASRYGGHPAMGMWDVWNEPESCLYLREPDARTLVCYCGRCDEGFRAWLKDKYGQVERLNDVWGRCYDDFSQVELPRDPQLFCDMIDWRLFHQQSLAAEGRRRLALVKSLDAKHPVYLHPVPNTTHFNAVTSVDMYDIAEGGDCYAGSVIGFPLNPLHILAGSEGRVCYSAESHLRPGMTGVYPRTLTLDTIAWEFVAQIGLGIRGFLYWQYRCETLGIESPAWGLLDQDGRPGRTHEAACEFWRRLRPVAKRLMAAPVEPAEAAIYQSSSNEVFHWCLNGDFRTLRQSVERFTQWLYERNVRLTYVGEKAIRRGLSDRIKLLVLPAVHALDQATAAAIVAWVRKGGTLICEALTGMYDLTAGRHGMVLPGAGLAEGLGLREINPTASVHLKLSDQSEGAMQLVGDTAKAFEAHGTRGGDLVPLSTADGATLWGKTHYAELEAEGLEALAGLPGHPPCAGWRKVGDGGVLYIGTLIAWDRNARTPDVLDGVLERAAVRSGVARDCPPWRAAAAGVRIDRLDTGDGEAFAAVNMTGSPVELTYDGDEPLTALYGSRMDGSRLTLANGTADLLVPSRWLK